MTDRSVNVNPCRIKLIVTSPLSWGCEVRRPVKSSLRAYRSHDLRCSAKNHHTPPPGLAFGEPDDRLQRGIQYAAASRFHRSRLWNTGSPCQAGDDGWEYGRVLRP